MLCKNMTNSKQKKIIAGVAATVLLGFMVSLSLAMEIEAEGEPYTTKSANNVNIHTVFTFRNAVEESVNGFEVFSQKSGFDQTLSDPVFELEGVIDNSRTFLYEAADVIHTYGGNDVFHPYAHFEVDVYLQKDGVNLRHFAYTDCMVSDYAVDTIFDKEEGWYGKTGFAIVDSFEFECAGYKPTNPLYEMMEEEERIKKMNGRGSHSEEVSSDKYPAIPS